MDNKRKRYLKLNLMSLLFTGISFISITLAWFAYSGIATVQTIVNVQAWEIKFTKSGQPQTNTIMVTLDDVSPGMQVKSEIININNLGDADATIDYEIKSVRLFDEYITASSKEELEDKLSHNYPFKINMSLSDRHANAHDGTGEFTVSVSWPLDSGDDKADSDWGKKAYEFNYSEQQKKDQDNTYIIRPSISIEISLNAQQYVDSPLSQDPEFKLGTIVLYDFVNDKKCTSLEGTCIKSYVVDVNNKLDVYATIDGKEVGGDQTVTLLPDLYSTYPTATADTYEQVMNSLITSWAVQSRGLTVNDILPIISRDIVNTVMMRPPKSNEIIGYLNYGNRVNDYISSTIQENGYYRYLNEQFPYLVSSKCYWLQTEYGNTKFALTKVDAEYSKIYNAPSNTECSVIPIVTISKAKLRVQ